MPGTLVPVPAPARRPRSVTRNRAPVNRSNPARAGSSLGPLAVDGSCPVAVDRYRLATAGYHARGVGRAARYVTYRLLRPFPRLAPVSAAATSQRVALDRVLLGYQSDIPGNEYARLTNDLLWSSTPVSEGPHVDLLRRAEALGVEAATADGFATTPYGILARNCIELDGHFFGATTVEGVADHARRFARASLGEGTHPRTERGGSPHGAPVEVHPIAHSDCVQLSDGHHRVAAAVVQGSTHLTVSNIGIPTTTALQDHLAGMRSQAGRRALRQPIDAPELRREWPLARRCTDRLDRMLHVLGGLGVGPPASYLDVGATYGWFVASMSQAGYDAHGVEIDPMAPELARAAYGVDPNRMTTADAAAVLGSSPGAWDVVSCFGLLHRFALGDGSCSGEELVRRLGRSARRVVFLDTGQGDERRYRDRLPHWTPEYVQEYLRRYGEFSEVLDLGPDDDRRVPFHEEYGRHLFACIPR